jgi:hypothetical protein
VRRRRLSDGRITTGASRAVTRRRGTRRPRTLQGSRCGTFRRQAALTHACRTARYSAFWTDAGAAELVGACHACAVLGNRREAAVGDTAMNHQQSTTRNVVLGIYQRARAGPTRSRQWNCGVITGCRHRGMWGQCQRGAYDRSCRLNDHVRPILLAVGHPALADFPAHAGMNRCWGGPRRS